MTPARVIRLVVGREVGDRLRNRAFVVTTAIAVVAIAGIIVGPTLFGDDGPTEWDVGVLDGADVPAGFGDVFVTVAESADVVASARDVPDRAAADRAVEDGDLDAVVIDQSTVLGTDVGGDLRRTIEQALAASRLAAVLDRAGVDPGEANAALGVEVTVVDPEGADEEARDGMFGLGLAVTVLLFLTLQINGASVLTTTVEEKSSRVVEVLLSTVRPWQLLAGKLVAMTVLSVGQLVLYAGTALLAAQATRDVTLPPASPMILLTSIVMFLLGFGLWASVFAVAGALATSAEEAQSAAAPIGFLAAAVYLTVIIGVVPNPDGTLARVLSLVPFSAPFAIPARAASGLATWEFLVGAGLTALGTWVGVRLAGRLYAAAVLAGGRMTWRDAFRAEPIR